MAEFDWKELDQARADLVKRAAALKQKQAFVQMPGGAPADAGAAGGAPAAAGAAGGLPPELAAQDPAAAAAAGGAGAAGAVDQAALAALAGGAPMGVDAATAGLLGGAPAPDAAAAGAGGAAAGAAGAGTPEPTLTLTLSQLWDVVTKVLGLAKKIGANGQGVPAEGGAAAPVPQQDAIKAAVMEALGDMGLTR